MLVVSDLPGLPFEATRSTAFLFFAPGTGNPARATAERVHLPVLAGLEPLKFFQLSSGLLRIAEPAIEH